MNKIFHTFANRFWGVNTRNRRSLKGLADVAQLARAADL